MVFIATLERFIDYQTFYVEKNIIIIIYYN